MEKDYLDGLARAAAINRSLAQLGRNCGQTGVGPDALEAAAKAIEAEMDDEPTPPIGVRICEACGQARRG
jgi:hypothetical protein